MSKMTLFCHVQITSLIYIYIYIYIKFKLKSRQLRFHFYEKMMWHSPKRNYIEYKI